MYVLGSDEDETGDSTIKSYYQPLQEDKNIGPGEYDPKLPFKKIEHSFSRTERQSKLAEDAKKAPDHLGPGTYNVVVKCEK